MLKTIFNKLSKTEKESIFARSFEDMTKIRDHKLICTTDKVFFGADDDTYYQVIFHKKKEYIEYPTISNKSLLTQPNARTIIVPKISYTTMRALCESVANQCLTRLDISFSDAIWERFTRLIQH